MGHGDIDPAGGSLAGGQKRRLDVMQAQKSRVEDSSRLF
jgi:hypothetical protein